jgi:hypothetical protein
MLDLQVFRTRCADSIDCGLVVGQNKTSCHIVWLLNVQRLRSHYKGRVRTHFVHKAKNNLRVICKPSS